MSLWVEKHFTPAELPGLCWSSAEGYQRHPGPGMVCAFSKIHHPHPIPVPTICWPTLWIPPSVLPPIGKLAGGCTGSTPHIWAFGPGVEGGGGWLWCSEGCSLVVQRATPQHFPHERSSGGLLECLWAIWGEVERGEEQLDAYSCYLSLGSGAPYQSVSRKCRRQPSRTWQRIDSSEHKTLAIHLQRLQMQHKKHVMLS